MLPHCMHLLDVECIDSPTIGIPDVGCSQCHQRGNLNYLFLIHRKEVNLPKAWDSMIQSCFEACNNPSIEPQWEKKNRNSVDPDILEEDQPSRTHAAKKHRHKIANPMHNVKLLLMQLFRSCVAFFSVSCYRETPCCSCCCGRPGSSCSSLSLPLSLRWLRGTRPLLCFLLLWWFASNVVVSHKIVPPLGNNSLL
jgi:hypothetical protein